MTQRKTILSMVLVLRLMCGFSTVAYAHEIPDENRKGTITVEMEYNGSAVTGGVLTVYRVGEIRENNGNYNFGKTAAMEGFTGSYENVGSVSFAEDVAAFVERKKLPAYAVAKNENGKAVFSDLELGLYLITQTENSSGYEPLKPFLASVPMNEDGRYVYEIHAEGKFQLIQTPKPTTPDKPKDPTLPQTGQLNWPVPLLAILGLCLFAAGWALRFGQKKETYEK